MIRRPPRSTQSRSSAASDVYKRQIIAGATGQAAGAHSVSATIINHPFNPDRAFGGNASRPSQVPRGQTVEKKELRSLFVLPLFRGIMVRDKPLAKATSGRSRQQLSLIHISEPTR